MAPIIKPRVPLYLRQNGPHHMPPYPNEATITAMTFHEIELYHNGRYQLHDKKYRQGSLCRCLECGWLGREKKLKIRFHEKVLRGFELCPRCACLKLQFFDNLTPAQEALLEP